MLKICSIWFMCVCICAHVFMNMHVHVPMRPAKAIESCGDGMVGVCEPANVATGIKTLVLMTEQLTFPSWVSPCQSPFFPTLLKLLHDLILCFLTCKIVFSHTKGKKKKKRKNKNPFALVVCFEREIRTCKDYTWSGAWHTINTLIFLNCDRSHWDFTLGGGVHKVRAQLDSYLSLWLSLWVSYGLRS